MGGGTPCRNADEANATTGGEAVFPKNMLLFA